MLTQLHEEALANTRQFDLGMDLLSRLRAVTSYSERIQLLERAEEAFDQLEVRAHAIRVADAARELSLHCGFDQTYANKLYNATRLHDVGKLFMPMHILEKDGRPTEDEYALIKEHARHGGDLLGDSAPEFVRNVARFHHERYDGEGYNGLVGENIPLEARLVQIADVYDALRSKRSYKPGLSEETTLERMVNMHSKGVMFDPYYLRRFVEMRLDADLDKEIGAEATARLTAFAKSSPMTELEAHPQRDIFEGWKIDAKGTRRRHEYDADIDYNKLTEMRDVLGNVKFKVEEQTLRFVAEFEAANDDRPTPRGPRF
nr:HD domain-containing phosphohydrolase [Neorhizobium tomejilense]